MCRAGGRRCRGSQASSRATQTARKQRSRARQALRQAKAAGDDDAIARAEQRLAQANANVQAAKENIVHSDDNGNAAGHGGDVTEPTPVSVPVTGELSDQPLLANTWGDLLQNSPVHYHDDGPVGTAVRYMGPDARMDVDGEPLANVVGRIATDVVRRKTKAQQAVDDLKELRDRLPEGSRARTCLSQAVRDMDGPDTPVPQVPDGTPEVLHDLVRKLHAVPMVRREPDKELQPLLDICGRVAAGDKRARALMGDEVKRLRNKRHESLGDSGKFEIDDAVNDAVTALKEQARQQREQRRAGDVTTHGQDHDDGFNHVGTVHGDVHTYGDVVHFGDTTTIHNRTSSGPDRETRRAQRETRRADSDTDYHHGDVDQRRATYTFGRSQSFTANTSAQGGDVTDNRTTNDTTTTQDLVTISVRVQGTCPGGHLVFHNLPVNAIKGSHGFARATTDCPSCGRLVDMTGSYTA